MIVIVTGCGGFIGKSLAEQLLRNPDLTELWNMDVRPLQLADPRVHNALVDLRDPQALDRHRDLLQRADYVYHLAAVTKRHTLRQFIDFNVRPTKLLLERLKGGKIKRFLYVSSQSACSPAAGLGRPVVEDEPMRPVEAYGRSKLIAETAVRRSGVPFVIVRPSSVYGPHDPDYREIFYLVAKGLHIYPSCRFKYYSAIFVEDLVVGLIQAATHPAGHNQTYFLTADEELRWDQVYAVIAKTIGKRAAFHWNIPYFMVQMAGLLGTIAGVLQKNFPVVNRQKVRLSEPQFWTCTVAAARRDIGFKPAWSLEAGIRETHRLLKELGYLKA